jgi:hypothetical protein
VLGIIHRVVYDMGFRPKSSSVFYSQPLAFKTAYIQAILNSPLRALTTMNISQPEVWTEIADALDLLKPYDAQVTVYDRMNFCPVCGTVLVRLVVDVKECPHLHGMAYVTEDSSGLPVITFELTETLDG